MGDMWVQLLAAQEQGKAQARETHRLQVDNKRLILVHDHNRVIEGSETLIDLRGPGVIDEITLKSPSLFHIKLYVDGKCFYDSPITDIIPDAEFIDNIIATERDGRYIFSVFNISYIDRASCTVVAEDTATFDLIFVRGRGTPVKPEIVEEAPDGGS